SGVLGRYSKDALKDTLELGRRSIASRGAKELVDLSIEFVSRRSHAFFDSIDELNAIAKAKTLAACRQLATCCARQARELPPDTSGGPTMTERWYLTCLVAPSLWRRHAWLLRCSEDRRDFGS